MGKGKRRSVLRKVVLLWQMVCVWGGVNFKGSGNCAYLNKYNLYVQNPPDDFLLGKDIKIKECCEGGIKT